MKLYEISARYQQLLDQDEYTPEEMVELESAHDNMEDQFIDRAKYIRNLEAMSHAIEIAANEMQARSIRLFERAQKQREILATHMAILNIKKVTKSPLFELHLKKNPLKVDDFNSTLIPSAYWYIPEITPKSKINKSAIKQAIEAGLEVPGARLVSDLRIEFK